MQSITRITQADLTQEILAQRTCQGCGQDIEVVRQQYAFGPKAGEYFEAVKGCKCEDLAIARQAVENEERMIRRKLEDTFSSGSTINDKLLHATFDGYDATTPELTEAKERFERFAHDLKGTLLVSGSYGTGKSHLSMATVNAVKEKGESAIFISLPRLLTKIKGTFGNEGSQDDIITSLADVTLLVLDDIGAEQVKYTDGSKTTIDTDTFSNDVLFQVLDARMGKPTIYTTNLTGKDLRARIGQRNWSRMLDDADIVKMYGDDYRLAKFNF